MKLEPTMIQIIKLIGGTAFWIAIAMVLTVNIAPIAGHMTEPCQCPLMIEEGR